MDLDTVEISRRHIAEVARDSHTYAEVKQIKREALRDPYREDRRPAVVRVKRSALPFRWDGDTVRPGDVLRGGVERLGEIVACGRGEWLEKPKGQVR